jgi:hypothetical protein
MAARPSIAPWTLVLLFCASTTQAATVSWLNPVNGDWFDATKWSGGVVPGGSDDVVIDVPGTYTVDAHFLGPISPNISVRSFALGGSTGAQRLVMTSKNFSISAASSVGERGVLVLDHVSISGAGIVNHGMMDFVQGNLSGPLDHYGTLIVHGGGLFNSLPGATSISRPGSLIQIGSDPSSINTRLNIGSFVNHGRILFWSSKLVNIGDALVSTTCVNAPDGVIESTPGNAGGSYDLGIGENQGLIKVGSPLRIPAGSGGVTNSGSIEIAAGSELAVTSGVYNYGPGTTTGAGRLRLTNVTVPELTTLPTSAPVLLDGAVTMTNLHNGGTILVSGAANKVTNLTTDAGSSLRILDNGTSTPTELTVRNNSTNLGTIDIAAAGTAPYNRLLMLIGKLTNGPGGTIRSEAGFGAPGVVQGRVDNAGTIVANGQLTMLGGPLLHLPGADVRGTGTFSISGAGYVDQGETSPGESVGALTMVGDDLRSSTSGLTIEIGGLAPGTEHDLLAVTGALQCAGTLRLVLTGGYVPAAGDVFTIATAAAVSGVFDSIEGQFLPGGLAFQPVYESDRVDLRVVESSTPVLLRTFDGEAGEGGIVLRWQIEERASFSDLAVERSDREEGPWADRSLAIATDGAYETATDDDVAAGSAYWYRLSARRSDGTRTTFGPIRVTGGGALELALARVLPNPSAGPARFRFALPAAGVARLTVHDVRGRLVGTPLARAVDAGWHEVAWRGDAAPGVYLLVLEAGGKRLTQRFTVVR